jgi:hypothetical protein
LFLQTTTTTNNNNNNNNNPYVLIVLSFSGVCDPAMREKHYCQDHGESVCMHNKADSKVTYSDTPEQDTFSKMIFFSKILFLAWHVRGRRKVRTCFLVGKREGRKALGRPGH